ncbi:hypothetical protein [Silvibacterium acidisoli]|uniref:hypothetical protein n=1 Tax=Acidobacteriaceae bacterium ZG23-2 TaxID=2883246 RepID=UPI00406D406D
MNARQWLTHFSHASAIGVGIRDAQNRYRCLNTALARNNCASLEDHLENTIYDVLGEVAIALEPSLHKAAMTGNPILARVRGNLPNAAKRSEWMTWQLPLARPGYRKIAGWGSVVVDITPVARVESFLSTVISRPDFSPDAETAGFVCGLQYALEGYSSALSSTMNTVVQRAWQTEQIVDDQMTPFIHAMDERLVEMRRLIENIEASLEHCLYPRN